MTKAMVQIPGTNYGIVPSNKVWVQTWWESEVGGWERPNGYSIHLLQGDVQEFIDEYWRGMPSKAPDEYSFPKGDPYRAKVDKETWQKIFNSRKSGLKFLGRPPDGWTPHKKVKGGRIETTLGAV